MCHADILAQRERELEHGDAQHKQSDGVWEKKGTTSVGVGQVGEPPSYRRLTAMPMDTSRNSQRGSLLALLSHLCRVCLWKVLHAEQLNSAVKVLCIMRDPIP